MPPRTPSASLPELALVSRQRRVAVDTRWLRRGARLALPRCAVLSDDGGFALCTLPEICVAVVSDAIMARLHVEFMGLAGPTDVLTFEHGEIVVSAETAAMHAARRAHPIERELLLYIIHGLLHLNGYDDRTPSAAARMRRTQSGVLRAILRQLPPP
jgi:probable rRNA maturation factor